MDNLTYSSNSNASKTRKPKPKIVTNAVTTKKETKMGKLASIFIAEDVANVKEYMWNSVIVPNIKTAMCDLLASACDVITNSFSMMVNGTTARPVGRNRYSTAPGRTNYNNCFVQPHVDNNQNKPQDNPGQATPATNFIFATKDDADMTLQYLMGELAEYGSVTVSDLYDCVGKTLPENWVASSIGWTDLSKATIHHTRGGWELYLPRVRKL